MWEHCKHQRARRALQTYPCLRCLHPDRRITSPLTGERTKSDCCFAIGTGKRRSATAVIHGARTFAWSVPVARLEADKLETKVSPDVPACIGSWADGKPAVSFRNASPFSVFTPDSYDSTPVSRVRERLGSFLVAEGALMRSAQGGVRRPVFRFVKYPDRLW
jgi:hypothetical protein